MFSFPLPLSKVNFSPHTRQDIECDYRKSHCCSFSAAVFPLVLMQVGPVEGDPGLNGLQTHPTAQELFEFLVPTFHNDPNNRNDEQEMSVTLMEILRYT